MSQTLSKDIECILVNDCSSDGSMDIAEQMVAEYQGEIRFLLLHHSQNRGLSAARNTGLQHATGEFIGFLDSDDWIEPDMYEVLFNLIKDDPDCAFTTSGIIGEEKDGPKNYYYDTDIYKKTGVLSPLQYLESIFINNSDPTSWNKLFRKSYITTTFVEGRNAEDFYFHYKNCRNLIAKTPNAHIRTTDRLLYHYRRTNPTAITAKNTQSTKLWYADYYQNLFEIKQDCAKWNTHLSKIIDETYPQKLALYFGFISSNIAFIRSNRDFIKFYREQLLSVKLSSLPLTKRIDIWLACHLPYGFDMRYAIKRIYLSI